MLGERVKIPTDTLIDMLYIIAGYVAITANDEAEIEQGQCELQCREGAAGAFEPNQEKRARFCYEPAALRRPALAACKAESGTSESIKRGAVPGTQNKETAVKRTKAIIFTTTAKLGPALVLALIACSVTFAQDVRTNYIPGTDFSKYHTYAWVDEVQGVPVVGGHPDQILDTQVKQAIDSQMASRGFAKVADGGKPDLLLGYQLIIDPEKQINGFGDSWGGWGGWGPWGGGSFGSFSASTSTINIGTFVIGMYDPAVKKLVWIGGAQHAIEPSKKPEKNQERLNKGAQKLLKDFPPGRSK